MHWCYVLGRNSTYLICPYHNGNLVESRALDDLTIFKHDVLRWKVVIVLIRKISWYGRPGIVDNKLIREDSWYLLPCLEVIYLWQFWAKPLRLIYTHRAQIQIFKTQISINGRNVSRNEQAHYKNRITSSNVQ